jgi:hypothetical protein
MDQSLSFLSLQPRGPSHPLLLLTIFCNRSRMRETLGYAQQHGGELGRIRELFGLQAPRVFR